MKWGFFKNLRDDLEQIVNEFISGEEIEEELDDELDKEILDFEDSIEQESFIHTEPEAIIQEEPVLEEKYPFLFFLMNLLQFQD